jgi:hypothetical protein
LARRFVMWRQRAMTGVINIWQHATIKAERRLSTRVARKYVPDPAWIGR